MKSSRSRAPSPTGTTFSGVSDYSTDSSRSTGTTFSGVSNHRAESYRPLRKSVPPMSQIDYRAVSEVHFNEFDRYLQAYFARSPPGRRSTARQKLTRLTVQQFYELSTDVYDELIRRKNEKEGKRGSPLSCPASHYVPVPFLSARDGFHPKRNEARQKLATLPITRFEDLCGDVHWQLQRRYPEFKEDPSRSKDREPDDREPDDREPEYRAPRDGSSVSSMGDTSNLTAQQQSTTGVPNKSTVEEEDNEIPFGRENGDSRRNIPLHPTVPFIPVNSPGPMPDPVFIQAGRPPVIPIGPQGPFVPMPHPESYQPEAPFIPFIPEERSPIRDDPTLVIQDSSSDSGSERDRERGRERDHRNIPPSPTAPSIPPDLPGPMPQAGRPPVIPIGPQVPFVPMPQPQSYQPEAPFIPFIPSQSPIQALDPNLVIQDSGGGSSGSGSDTERDRERGRERDRRNIPPSPTAPSIPPDLPGPMPQAGRPPVIPIGPQGPFVPIPHPEPYQQDPEGPFISYIPEERSPIQGLDPTLVIQDSGSGSSDSGSERYRERGRERDRRRHEGGRSRSRSGSGRSSSSGSRSSSPPQIIIQQSQPPVSGFIPPTASGFIHQPVVMAPSSASTAAPAFPDSSSFPNGHGDTGPGTNQSATNDEEPQASTYF
ncbi:hypothetical protein B0H19DRAFT_1255900 [Mycena capillaripes]|nr:hypothetical protein B0H19DRAFT_1255900 [Mycena capillaripes]